MTPNRSSPDRTFTGFASLAVVGVVVDVILLTGSDVPTALIVLKYPLAVAVALLVLAAGRAVRRAEAACLEDLRD